jgi:hypothetical protein
MLINIKKITEICVKLRIDIEEFYFLYLVSAKDYTTMKYYVKHINGFTVEFIDNLQKKGLLLDTNAYSKSSDYRNGNKIVKLTTLFSTPVFDDMLEEDIDIASTNIYEEMRNVYPYEIIGSNGINYPARTGTYEKNSSLYIKHILKNPDDHNKIIEAIKYGKENGLIKWGLEKFIENEYWGLLIEAMDGNRRQTEGGETMYGNNEF